MIIYIIGMGPGDASYLTEQAKIVVSSLSALIGVKRQLETVTPYINESTKSLAYSGRLDDLKEKILTAYKDTETIGVLASGDPSFYGISAWLKRTFTDAEFKLIPGISSTQILFAKTMIPMHDFYMTSLHGREDAKDMLLNYPKICLLTDKTYTPYAIAQHYLENGLNPRIVVGENLSYPDECITDCLCDALSQREYKMSVVIIINER